MTAIDERVDGRGPAGAARPEHCVLHGGPLPQLAPTCPDCAGAGGGPTTGPTTGPGTDPAAAPTSGPSGPAGPPPLLEYDPEAITAAAGAARLAADGITATLTARSAELATTTGSLQLVAALTAAAATSTATAQRLGSDVSTVSDNLGLTLADYARVDDDLAVAFDALLPA